MTPILQLLIALAVFSFATANRPALCNLPSALGNCRSFQPRYFFNSKTGKCAKFVYGGCGGNPNKFKTLAECEKICAQVKKVVASKRPAVCNLPSVVGKCRSFQPRFYFNSKTGKCDRFIYGGCGSNGNNFKTLDQCQKICRVVQEVKEDKRPDVCNLPSVVGKCRSFQPRFYFNYKTGKCDRFIYGGCGSNGNNFKTLDQCQKICRVVAAPVVVKERPDVCNLPSVRGKCRSFQPRFYFNSKTGKCDRFIYGGCGSNGNNFKTLDQCQKICRVVAAPVVVKKRPDVCNRPSVRGKCRRFQRRFFYNTKTGKCAKFVYGGCGSNGNNFRTLDQCRKICRVGQ